jgi:hypothetical protein
MHVRSIEENARCSISGYENAEWWIPSMAYISFEQSVGSSKTSILLGIQPINQEN